MPSLSTILAGFTLALAIAVGVLIWRYDAALTREASAKAALSTALTANAALIEDAKRYKAQAEAEQARALARQHEREAMAGQLVELRRALGSGGCEWTPERAQAIDRFLGGETVK